MGDVAEKEKALKMAEIYCRRFGRKPTDDEKSIALTAWFEAERKFNPEKQAKLETFAEKVIIRRLINYFKKKVSVEKHIAYDVDITTVPASDTETDEERLHELERFERIMNNLGYDLADFEKTYKPRYRETRKKLQEIALHIVGLGLGMRFIKEKPHSRELLKLINADRRIIRKYRPYLTAIIVTYVYDLPIIRGYVEALRKEK